MLPLYFSRPLRRSDYALAKLAAMISAVWLLLAGPLLLIFLGGAFSRSGGASAVWREFTDFLGGLGYAAMTAVVLGSFAVPLASLASRRAIAAVVIVVAFAATAPVIGVVDAVGGTTAQQLGPAGQPGHPAQRVWRRGSTGTTSWTSAATGRCTWWSRLRW